MPAAGGGVVTSDGVVAILKSDAARAVWAVLQLMFGAGTVGVETVLQAEGGIAIRRWEAMLS